MTVEDFLEKWAGALNGGDERHLHNDLDRVVAAVRHECALKILTVPMHPGFVLDLCREWMGPDPSGSDDNG